ncbi:MAG: START domain-containing protein [Bacteroidota bacterium]|nr:START domain-containing protein [Bacteroidota bacterium]
MKLFVQLVFMLGIVSICFAQKDWQLAKEKNGTRVYTKFYKNAGIKQLRVESTFTGVTLHAFFAVFKDVPNAVKWTSHLKRAYSIKEFAVNDYINYFEIDVPWPLKNREAIFNVKAYQDEDKTLNIKSEINPNIWPESDTIVRIVDALGVWKFTPLGEGKTKVQSILYADPRGFPGWIVNLFAVDSPVETHLNLKKHVQNEKYKNAHFDFIKE